MLSGYRGRIQLQKEYPRAQVHPLIYSSVQSLSRVRLFATPGIAARQASLSITNSRSSLRLMSIESVMPSSHLILCRPLLLPPTPPSIRVFSNESTLCMRWPKYWRLTYKHAQSILILLNLPSHPHLPLSSYILLQRYFQPNLLGHFHCLLF